MDDMTNKQTCKPCSTLAPLGMHRDSKTISKTKPKIRIIHIFAPEIIKTDVANFRELVQRLTGKPMEKGCNKKPSRIPRREEPRSASSDKPTALTKKMELPSGFRSNLESRERIKDEEEGILWNAEKSGGFLGSLSELEDFIQDLGDEFPFLPLDASRLHSIEEAQLT
ncbi:hypothetical protein ACB098_09G119300 [Castanea mollissima]|uniref:VQ domain-containing protein n=1 Tax=Castanea mollissima TaxID=60419 RepID=A0A8J4VV40_9ROSI|nr:hypothetical protein CMV_013294 [Castanea mollissima]